MTKTYFVAGDPDLTPYSPEDKINLLGGKGAGLQFMLDGAIQVPPFVTIPTTMYTEYAADPKKTMAKVKAELDAICDYFINIFGYMPLLSVRSGARASMPGMMDTVLNVGLDASTYALWEKKLGEKCVENCYDRLHAMYGETVLGLEKGVHPDLPKAKVQLLKCIEAVFKSWNTERAQIYRKMNNIPDDWGTAVTVQAMVFGNYNEKSCSGVLFTRNPDTGLAKVTGEFLVNAQGEDVVAGTVTPQKLEEMSDWNDAVYQELMNTVLHLETQKRDVQDVEFTVQDGKLYILQTRNAKRSAMAAITIAMDMWAEGMLTPEEAIKRVTIKDFDNCQMPVIDPKFKGTPLFTGIPACSGVVQGVVVTTAKAAIDCQQPCILVTEETTPDDIGGMIAAKGVLTMAGGATSHAAVVARGMNKPCVVGLCQDIELFKEGMTITIDGATGNVYFVEVPVIAPSESAVLNQFKDMLWGQVQASPIGGKNSKLLRVADLCVLGFEDKVTVMAQRIAATTGEVYVDMRNDSLSDMEEGFYACFRVKEEATWSSVMGGESDTLLKALADEIRVNQPKRVKDVIFISGGKAEGFKVVAPANTLVEVIMAEGEVLLAKDKITDKQALNKLLKMRDCSDAHKLSVISVGELLPGSKSFISESTLIATLLN